MKLSDSLGPAPVKPGLLSSALRKQQARLRGAQTFLTQAGIDYNTAWEIPVTNQLQGSLADMEKDFYKEPRKSSRDSYKQRLVKLKRMRSYASSPEMLDALDSAIRAYEAQLGEGQKQESEGGVGGGGDQKPPEEPVMEFECDHSSMVTTLTYNVQDETLVAVFRNNGSVVEYSSVPPGVYAELELTNLKGESVGKAFWRLVRGKFSGLNQHEGGIYPFRYLSRGEGHPREIIITPKDIAKYRGWSPKQLHTVSQALEQQYPSTPVAEALGELLKKDQEGRQRIIEQKKSANKTAYARRKFKEHPIFLEYKE